MMCPICGGERFVRMETADGGLALFPCAECMGSGVVSCCDAAGWADLAARVAYRDDAFRERACGHCGKLYRGPAVYCSLNCAVADA